MFKLQEITAMKLHCCKQLQQEIEYAERHNLPCHKTECEKELVKTKYEAMHPQEVLEWLNHRFPHSA